MLRSKMPPRALRNGLRAVSVALLLAVAPAAHAQQQLSLPQVIELALDQSAVAQQAQTSRETSYWRWRTYRAAYMPQLSLQGTVPDFSRVIAPVIQPDGTTDFRAVRINNSNLAVTMSQNIGLTGGQIFVSSDVQRFDDFDRKQRRYNTTPAIIGLSQPIGGYNRLYWARRIEPLRYEESQRQFVAQRENIAQRIAELYFDVLQQQVNAEVAGQNVRANEEMLRMGKERYQLGRLSQNDLLQLEVNLLTARRNQGQAVLDAQNAALELQNYTSIGGTTVSLQVPPAPALLAVAPDKALNLARQHRSEMLTFQRQLLQADSSVAGAKGTTGLQASLTANLGYVNRADRFLDSYQDPLNQQQVRLAFSMPLVDWGRQKSIIKTAELTRQQVQRNVQQSQATFEQTVLTQAAQLSTLSEQLALAARADTLAQRRYDIARATYQVGRYSLTDLNIALSEKDQAKRAYIVALRAGWVAYYRLRALTLYDFERQRPLVENP
ncbi:TolC family protein [Hymenobacter radiodurans]|uniref:TolC family protein n=1 Tax=Hymenobacter radiodurans TaxID=2496028 RepID=UPI001F0F2E5D|nr:TolC family protein [Hymenobacter radiodurans]